MGLTSYDLPCHASEKHSNRACCGKLEDMQENPFLGNETGLP